MMSDKPTIEIDRATWGFGERVADDDGSYLLRDDGLQCCIGVALKQLGVPDAALLYVRTPYSVGYKITIESGRHVWRAVDASWVRIPNMFIEHKNCTLWAWRAMQMNDSIVSRDEPGGFDTTAKREAALVAHGEADAAPIRFKFVGEYPPGVEVL
jgi:hypothetical protein